MAELEKLHGFWWLPDEPSRRVAGHFEPANGLFELSLFEDKTGSVEFSHGRENEYPVIHGLTTDGKEVTLLDSFDAGTSRTGYGIGTRRIISNYVLLGGLVPDTPKFEHFLSIAMKWPKLNKWFLRSGVSAEHGKNLKSFEIKYDKPDPITIQYSDELELQVEFLVDKIPTGGPLTPDVEFSESVVIRLVGTEQRSLGYFLDKHQELVQFFSICVSELSQPDEVTLRGDFDIRELQDGTKIYPNLTAYFSYTHRSNTDRHPHPVEDFIRYSDIESGFPDIVQNWVSLARKVTPVRSLYFAAIYGQNQFLETTFLNLVQAVEVFHRRFYGGKYVDETEYDENIKPYLVNAIPCELDSNIRNVFQQKLQFLNEYSLSKRLKELALRHEMLLNQLEPKWKKSLQAIVDARNHLTHFSSEKNETEKRVFDLFEYRKLLRLILDLEFSSAIGIDLETLHERAKSSWRVKMRFPDRQLD